MPHYLESSIEYLKGVGPNRGDLLKKELGIFTFGDLLQYYPFRYVDRSRFYKVNEVTEDIAYVQLKGTITRITSVGEKRTTRLIANFKDETGSIELVWFQSIKWMREALKAGTIYIVFGKPTVFNGKFNIVFIIHFLSVYHERIIMLSLIKKNLVLCVASSTQLHKRDFVFANFFS